MTRHLEAVVGGQVIPGWVMICDRCWTDPSDARPRHNDLRLEEFRDQGWLIGTLSDWCPACVEQAGGLEAAAKQLAPHRCMAALAPAGQLGLLHSPELWS